MSDHDTPTSNQELDITPHSVVELHLTMLQLCPTPVLVLDAQGAPVYSNPPAKGLSDGIRRRLFPEITALIERALKTQIAVVEVLTFPVRGGSASLEMTIMPMRDGSVFVMPRDISMDRNLREALIESRQRYRDIVEISSDFAWETDAEGRFIFVSPRGALDYAADDLVGRAPSVFFLDETDEDDAAVFSAKRAMQEIEIWFKRKDGSAACLSVSGKPLLDKEGNWRGARGLCQDITEERNRQSELARARNRDRLMTYIVRTIRDELDPSKMMARAAEASARALVAKSCQVFNLTDEGHLSETASQGKMPDPSLWNAAATLLLGGHQEAVLESIDFRLIALPTRYRKELNGAIAFWRPRIDADFDEGDRDLMHELADQLGIAIEQASNHDRIVRMSRTDGMTGLLNRRAFFDELERRFARLARDDRPAALMYVDMDNFKLVNDVHGHQRGDEAILALRDMLRNNTRSTDLVARLGGDEFVVWLEGIGEDSAKVRAEGLLLESWGLQQFSGKPDKPLGISLGIAVYDPRSDETLDNLILRADGAMYQVKHGGKGSYKIASASAAATA